MKSLNNGRNNVAPLNHRTHTYVAASKALGNGANDVIPDHLPNSSYVLRSQRVLVHERIHGRVDIRRRRGCQRAHQRCLFFFSNYLFYFWNGVEVRKQTRIWGRCNKRRGRNDGDGDGERGRREGGLTTRLSHTPVAIFASVLAEQGAMRTTSAQRRSSMCNIGSPMR